MSIGALYADGRGRISDLVSGLGEEAAAPVPACPQWSVHDVVAHVTGVCADILAGNLAGVWGGTEPSGRLEAPTFELMRALTGRRSRRQIRALGWTVDPAPYLPAFQFGPFTTSPTDLEE